MFTSATARRARRGRRLRAELDSDLGAAERARSTRWRAKPSYFFQYGTVELRGRTVVVHGAAGGAGGLVGSGFGDRRCERGTRRVLQPNTTYYYRVLAHNEHGTARKSAEQRKRSSRRCRAPRRSSLITVEWELVSPPEKHGAAVEPISREGALIQASADGDAITWTASAPVTGEAQRQPRDPNPCR